MLPSPGPGGFPAATFPGYLHSEGMSGEQSAVSASHAWAEFLVPGSGWVGLDPTNDTLADHPHVPSPSDETILTPHPPEALSSVVGSQVSKCGYPW